MSGTALAECWSMLVIIGGLPATGKTTICRAVTRLTGAVHLRIDTIEQAIVDSGLAHHPVGSVGYCVGYALAGDHLKQGLTVLVDCVNPLARTRDAWRTVATTNSKPALEVEVICSDLTEHQQRAESRAVDIPGLAWPTWEQIATREYEACHGERLVIDTSKLSVAEAAEELARAIRQNLS